MPEELSVRVGVMWDVLDDGTLRVSFAGQPPVDAVGVGAVPPLGAPVVCLSTYDRLYVLGADLRGGTPTEPDPPARISKRYDGGITTDPDGGWWVPIVVPGTWVGDIPTDGRVRVDFPHPIRTQADPAEWVVLAQYGSTAGITDRAIVVEARDRERDHMILTCPGATPGVRVRINYIVGVQPEQGI